MKWKTVGWAVMFVLAVITLLGANSYEETWKNLVSFSPPLLRFSGFLISILTNTYVMVIATGLASGYAGYRYGLTQSKSALESALADPRIHSQQKLVERLSKNAAKRTHDPNIDSIIFAVEEIIHALESEGPVNKEMIGGFAGRVRLPHKVWNDEKMETMRNVFIGMSQRAYDARLMADGEIPSDKPYPEEQRVEYLNSLKRFSETLVENLRAYKSSIGMY